MRSGSPVMPYGPSTRSDIECTTAPSAAGVGVSAASGVAPAPVPPTASASVSSVARPGGSPQHAQRIAGPRMGSSGPNRDSAGDAPPSPVPASMSDGAAPAQRGSSGVTLPPLTRTAAATAAAAPRAAPTQQGIGASAVALPAVSPRQMGTAAADPISEAGRVGGRRVSLGRTPAAAAAPAPVRPCGPGAPLPALTTSPAESRTEAIAHSAPSPSSPPAEQQRPRVPLTQEQREMYFRANRIPGLFDGLSADLLEAQPEDPCTFLEAWLRRRREAVEE